MPKFFIGVDPDMHATAVAVAMIGDDPNDTDPRIVALYSIRTDKNKKARTGILEMAEEFAEFVADADQFLPPGELIDCVAVEAQELYEHGPHKTPNPKSMMYLASIAGVCLMGLRVVASQADQVFPTPLQWKGNVTKPVHHQRIGHRLGWEMTSTTTHAFPVKPPAGLEQWVANFPHGHWKHVMDAVGLALWAADGRARVKRIKDQANANSQDASADSQQDGDRGNAASADGDTQG